MVNNSAELVEGSGIEIVNSEDVEYNFQSIQDLRDIKWLL
jgi:hypothetical protein